MRRPTWILWVLLSSASMPVQALAASADESGAEAAAAVTAPVERAVGRLNVNLATRAELASLGLDAATVERVLRDRSRRPIADLSGFAPELRRHLRTDGASDYRRIRQLPLVRYDGTTNSAPMACR